MTILLASRRRASVAAAGTFAVIAPPLVLADPPQPVLAVATLVLLVWAPGQVLAALLDPDDVVEEAVLVVAGGLSVNVLAALVLLYAEWWDPVRGVLLVSVLTALLAGAVLLRSRS